jgi:hypothetical protein
MNFPSLVLVSTSSTVKSLALSNCTAIIQKKVRKETDYDQKKEEKE